ncbi:MAG: ATP-binding protein [Terriglobales bacterium]
MHENPFIFGEIVSESAFIDREEELQSLVRDLADGQKLFLLSPRRFGKSSLVSAAFRQLQTQNVRTVVIPVSSYASYVQFLERFTDRLLRAAGPWDKVKDWVGRFINKIKPQANVDLSTGELSVSFGTGSEIDPAPIAPEVFALPGELAKHGRFKMAICLDEFQQILNFDGRAVEDALRNAVQLQRDVGYVFSGSQPSLVEEMLSAKRPFHKAGPKIFLDKIPADSWRNFILEQFRHRSRAVTDAALDRLLATADLIPYDVQRIAHELWDYAELNAKRNLDSDDVDLVTKRLVTGESGFYERLWEQLRSSQRAVLQALAARGAAEIYAQAVRQEYRLGPASSVQRALQSLDDQDILDRYHDFYFFVDPLFAVWIRNNR